MKIMRKIYFCMIVIILILTIPTQLLTSSKSKDKLTLQNETRGFLIEVESFAFASKKINALFTSQDQGTIAAYKERYCDLCKLIDGLTENLKEWGYKIRESKNDKIYRLYAAAVQTALYSIYSRPHKYIGFLKLVKPSSQRCPDSQKSELESFDDKIEDWEIKARVMKDQANSNIDKALKLDEYYTDAKILKAQLEGLEAKFNQSLLKFKALEEKKVFEERLSLLNSWKGFFEIKKGNFKEAKKLLRDANAFSSPARYSKWASAYLKSLITAKSVWIEYDFIDFIPLTNIRLEDLKKYSLSFISTIWEELSKPLKKIPTPLNPEKLKRLAKAPKSDVFWDLDTDHSEANLKKYAQVIENLYQAGISLEYCMKKWEELARNNKKIAYYYLLHKSGCSLSLLYVSKETIGLLKNPKLAQTLKYRQAVIKGKKIDYSAKCHQWSQILKESLEEDIKKILSQNPNYIYTIYARILDFEFHALFSSPQEANDKLKIIAEELRNRNIKKIPFFLGQHEIDVFSYCNAWKSYLSLKEGKIQSAREHMDVTGQGAENWREMQEKLIRLKSNQTISHLLKGGQ